MTKRFTRLSVWLLAGALCVYWGLFGQSVHQSVNRSFTRADVVSDRIIMQNGNFVDTAGLVRSEIQRDSGSGSGTPASLPRLLCWVMCDPDDLDRRVRHVRDTWAKHCDVTLFMSSATNTSFPTIGLDVPSGREHIALKSRSAWTYVYEHHAQHADYFVKADPDTFLIVPNLKLYLAHRDPDEAEFFGHGLSKPVVHYNSGGPGQVLSREALTRMVTKAFAQNCMPDGKGEDYKTASCLKLVNATLVDTRDQHGRETFLVFAPEDYLFKPEELPQWYYEMDTNGALVGKNCCSAIPIGFHYIKPPQMYAYYYIFYEIYQFRKPNPQIRFIDTRDKAVDKTVI